MSSQIWKFELDLIDNVLSVPENSEILCVKIQNGQPCTWFKVETTKPHVNREIVWFGTGQDIPEYQRGISYIDTVLLHNGNLIMHAFEVL